MKQLLYIVLFLLSIFAFSQDKDKFFSDAIDNHWSGYYQKAQQAVIIRDYERADFLYDSLVTNCLEGKFLDDFSAKKLNGSIFESEDLDKPFVLMTRSAWLAPSNGEIDAINKLAEEYYNEMEFIVLFWDSYDKILKMEDIIKGRVETEKVKKKNKTKKLDISTRSNDYDIAFSKSFYSENVTLLYIDETENYQSGIISDIKHSLGVPVSFYVNENKKILQIDRGNFVNLNTSSDEALTANMRHYESIINNTISNKQGVLVVE